ncbi:MAG TPA: PP2C family protein-serine/threonine phosphatase [Candidatus Elarobacter sp.]
MEVPAPLTTPAERLPLPEFDDDAAVVLHVDGRADVPNPTAAKVLIEHLFARGNSSIAGIEYAVGYQLANGYTGGDIVDVYHFDNDAVAFSIADISGKGTEAAIHAAMVKYGLRAYASQGQTPESVLRSMDRLYIENNAFEKIESFASIFFAMVDTSRRIMHYASGGHEPAVIAVPGDEIVTLAPTAPLIGVFDDQHHLFKQSFIPLPPGTVFVATTDGITEARAPDRSFFGMERFIATVEQFAEAPVELIVRTLISRARAFSADNLRDDVAIVAARFL